MIKMKLTDRLHKGRMNAVRPKDIARAYNCRTRDIRAAAEWEQLAGTPICTTIPGRGGDLYLASDSWEMHAYCERFRHWLEKETQVLEACETIAARLTTTELIMNGYLDEEEKPEGEHIWKV